ncbi:MAG: DUF45 domain-containing protein [Methanomicrobiaceae archaeon]|nr:DUF45 domain-containing protein [Methanomicrobiaceae archaeon]
MTKTDNNELNEGFVTINNRNFYFIVEYSEKRRKVSLEIIKGPKLLVKAPKGVRKEEIYFVLNSKSKWIAENYSSAEKKEKKEYSMTFGDITYIYTVKYKKRADDFGIKLFKDNRIEVAVPVFTEQEDVESFLRKNISLIHEKLNEKKREKTSRIELKDGGMVPFKGRIVRIKTVRSAAGAKPNLKSGILTITLPDNQMEDEKRIKNEISGLFQNATQNKINSYVPKYARMFGICTPETDISLYRTYWAKCIPAKNLVIFNECLAMLPDSLIEYVVAHELCHFFHPNHKPEFYKTLKKVMPDADKRCRMIENYGNFLESLQVNS